MTIRRPKDKQRKCKICRCDFALVPTGRTAVTCSPGCARVNLALQRTQKILNQVFGPGVTFKFSLLGKPRKKST